MGKFPDSEEVTAAVRIGQPLSMLVYAKDDEGNIQTHTRTGVIILTPVKALVFLITPRIFRRKICRLDPPAPAPKTCGCLLEASFFDPEPVS